jgi:hypothetical protein
VRGQLGLFTSPYSSCIELRLAAPGDGTVLCGVGGWLWYGPPTTDPSLRDFGVQLGSSPDAADALESVDCCEPSSRGAPSGPVVTTDVTEPGAACVTFVGAVPATLEVLVRPLSCDGSGAQPMSAA